VEALTLYGLALVKSGKAAEAQDPLKKAIGINDKVAESHYGLGLAYGYLKKLPEAIKELERAVELDGNHAYARYNLGLAYNQQKRIDLAVLQLRRFLELAPNAPEAPQVKALLRQLDRSRAWESGGPSLIL
jgi:tetratricopeptide (TPR) repeat protein